MWACGTGFSSPVNTFPATRPAKWAKARCRSIHMIPFDPHLAEGADVDFNLLNADTNAVAHTIVLVSSPAMDSARSASATLDWLMQHGYSSLVREAHVVLSASRPGSAGIKLDKVYEHFQARCRSIHMIPFDPHLAEGADVDFNLLNADTNAGRGTGPADPHHRLRCRFPADRCRGMGALLRVKAHRGPSAYRSADRRFERRQQPHRAPPESDAAR